MPGVSQRRDGVGILQIGGGFQSLGFVGALPGEAFVFATEVAVGGGLAVFDLVGVEQVQHVDLELFGHGLFNFGCPRAGSAMIPSVRLLEHLFEVDLELVAVAPRAQLSVQHLLGHDWSLALFEVFLFRLGNVLDDALDMEGVTTVVHRHLALNIFLLSLLLA